MKKRMVFTPVLITILLVLLYVYHLPLLALFKNLTTSEPNIIYKINNNYTGWITVKFSNSECQTQKDSKGNIEISINSNGFGCTQTDYPKSWHKSVYRYISSESNLKELEPKAKSIIKIENDNILAITFFIGSLEELNKSWELQPQINGN
jgi:hypothetical protein